MAPDTRFTVTVLAALAAAALMVWWVPASALADPVWTVIVTVLAVIVIVGGVLAVRR